MISSSSKIKTTDKKLKSLLNENNLSDQMPPIRKAGHIVTEKKKDEEEHNLDTKNKPLKASERIKSTDYDKWDKYNPEEEILRMELAEERRQEEVERKNRLNAEKIKREPLKITEILEEEDLKSSKGEDKKWSQLSDIEKEKLSEEFRLRGNEYFRAKEYDHAVTEYTRAIKACPYKAVAAYNNRALTFFKLQRFFDAIKDSEECLKLEPNNLKARIRLAEATYAYGKRRESYPLYVNILELEAENPVALKAISSLRNQFEDLPPPNATRLKIQEESSKPKPVKGNEQKSQALEKAKVESTKPKLEKEKHKEKEKEKPKPKKSVDYDLADLVQPNRVVKNKFLKSAEAMGQKMQNNLAEHNKQLNKQQHLNTTDIKIKDICMPSNKPNSSNNTGSKKPLIQEI
ncbi:hypothetical protein DOY81_002803 [Sarcophaga bullata]|nr:hypothetical protein DOY81_002803 [Sarcophaga bullata]